MKKCQIPPYPPHMTPPLKWGIDLSVKPQGCGVEVYHTVKSPLIPTYPRTGGGGAYN